MTVGRQNIPPAVDRFAQINDPGTAFKNPVTLAFMRALIRIIRDIGNDALYKNTASSALLLVATTGKAYEITINDNGSLNIKNARDGTPARIFIPPTVNPHVVGAIWNNGGTLAISAG